jgi:pyroglutamyl-peptidase
MIRVLLTGFDPFGDDDVNPSGLAVRRLAASWNGPAELITGILPVTFSDAARAIRSLMAEHEPQLVIATGLAGNRAAITPERVAVNLIDARIRDNAGEQPVDQAVRPGGLLLDVAGEGDRARHRCRGHPQRRLTHCGHVRLQPGLLRGDG